MNRGYIYIILLCVCIGYLLSIYIPIIKEYYKQK